MYVLRNKTLCGSFQVSKGLLFGRLLFLGVGSVVWIEHFTTISSVSKFVFRPTLNTTVRLTSSGM